MTADTQWPLSEIESGLSRLARPTIQLLKPGIDPATAGELLTRRGLEPPDDLLALWQWRNGTRTKNDATLGDLWLVPGFYLLSVEDATRNFDAFAANPRWHPAWLPVFANGGGDFLAVDCSARHDHGAVYHFRIEQSEHPLEYQSVERMVATFAAAFSRGAFYIDAQGSFEEDADAFATIAAEINPQVHWWTDPVT
jgi:hypothetical protein